MRLGRLIGLLSGVAVVCSTVGACGSGATRAAPPAVHNPGFGIAATSSMVLYEPDRTFNRDMDVIAASGAGWLRVDADWSALQPGPTRYEWSPLDRVVRAAGQRGIRLLLTAAYTPVWDRPAGATDKHPPTDVAAFGVFCQVLSRRYGPLGVHTFEIWNEPNIRTFWSTGADPQGYTALLQVAARAIRQADPAATIVTAGLAPAADAPARGSLSPRSFLSAVYDHGGRGSFDAVGVHPYTFPAEPTAAGTNFSLLPQIASLMAARGDGALPLWGTEFGAPTAKTPASVDRSSQARILREAYQAWEKWDFPVGPLFWYAHRDLGRDAGNTEDNFGLVGLDFAPKPAYRTFRQLAGHA